MHTILIADDEPRICGLLREFFQTDQGTHVASAHTGPEATRRLTQEHYDLALIGVPLAGSSGFDLAALAAKENTPVLLMTARSALQITMQQFAFPYLGKPFTLHALRAATERLLGDHAEQVAILKTSLKNMNVNRDALARAMEELDRLLDCARARQPLGRWDAALARMKDNLPYAELQEP